MAFEENKEWMAYFSLQEYRKSILDRYSQKILQTSESNTQRNKHISSKNFQFPYKNEECSVLKESEPVSLVHSKNSSIIRHSNTEKKISSLNNARPQSNEKEKLWSNKARNERRIIHRKAKSTLKTRGNNSLIRNASRETLNTQRSRKKINVKKNLENKAEALTIGELMRLYKIRRPSTQDLNLIQMLMVLWKLHLKSQLFKIGVSSSDAVKKITWKTAKAFFETHSKAIMSALKSIPKEIYNESQEELLSHFSVIHQHKLEYPDSESSNVIISFINAWDSVYINLIKRAKKEGESEEKAKRDEYSIDMHDASRVYEQNKPKTTCNSAYSQKTSHKSGCERVSDFSASGEKSQGKIIIENKRKKNIGEQKNIVVISSEPLIQPQAKEDTQSGENIWLPLGTIKEQNVRNEASNESLPEMVKIKRGNIAREVTVEEIKKSHTENNAKIKRPSLANTGRKEKSKQNKNTISILKYYEPSPVVWSQRNRKSRSSHCQNSKSVGRRKE